MSSVAALDVALEAVGTTSEAWVTVTDSAQRAVGVFTTSSLIAGCRRALAANTTRLSKLAGSAAPVELCVEAGAEAAGRAIRDAALPPGTIVVTIEPDGALVFAEGDTVLEAGALVSALARPNEVGVLRDPGRRRARGSSRITPTIETVALAKTFNTVRGIEELDLCAEPGRGPRPDSASDPGGAQRRS